MESRRVRRRISEHDEMRNASCLCYLYVLAPWLRSCLINAVHANQMPCTFRFIYTSSLKISGGPAR